MKYLKLFGLAAVAAMALMAFIGAGSASATALCNVTPTTSGTNIGECPTANRVVNLTSSLSGTAILETLTGSPPTVLDTCTVGGVAGSDEGGGSTTETAHGAITSLTWGAIGVPGCTKTTDTIAKGSLEVHAIGDTHNGTLTASGAEVTVNTIFGSCIYGTGNSKDLGEVVGGNPATITINTTVPKTGGNAACPAETRWTASYEVTSGPLYIATGTE
jgi:hypothetical protein